MKKFFLIFLFFYLLALIESSFLGSMGLNFYLIFITVFLINVLEYPQDSYGIFGAFSGGFFLDVFSRKFIGFYTLILLFLSILLKFLLRRYVRFFREK